MKFGECESFNLEKANEMFNINNTNSDLTSRRTRPVQNHIMMGTFVLKKWNETDLFKTPNKELGIDALIYRGLFFMPNMIGGNKIFYRITFHTPYELPNENYQQFLITELESVMFYVSPQLRTIDDSMLKLTPKELR